jgi:TRAP-type C4-dicarboxylate transport system substrate-binding protein
MRRRRNKEEIVMPMIKHWHATLTAAVVAAALLVTVILETHDRPAFVARAAAQDNKAGDGKTIVMKLATATLNDAQHDWMKRFAAAVEKNSNGRIRAEIYPASQLGNIPRQIEGTQLGSIQVFVGPPEFLVGVDQRFEMLGAPGVFQNDNQVIKTITDPEFAEWFLSLGINKGLIGTSILFNGPAAFAMRAPLRTLANFSGKKIRVLASPFQTEQIARLGGTGVPLSLGDVLPALQQGALDGALGSVPVFSTLQYQDAAKYITETGQAYVQTIAMLSKKWFDGLPSDLQATVLASAKQVDKEAIQWAVDFLGHQRKTWIEKGGELIALSQADKTELMVRTRSIGDDIVKSKPELKQAWEVLIGTARRSL